MTIKLSAENVQLLYLHRVFKLHHLKTGNAASLAEMIALEKRNPIIAKAYATPVEELMADFTSREELRELLAQVQMLP
jgi:hypothetical protein